MFRRPIELLAGLAIAGVLVLSMFGATSHTAQAAPDRGACALAAARAHAQCVWQPIARTTPRCAVLTLRRDGRWVSDPRTRREYFGFSPACPH